MSASAAVEAYERGFAERLGLPHAIAFNQARTALLAILAGAGLTRGAHVALSPLTCEVVPLALLAAGYCPRYVDVAAGTLNLDAAALESVRPGVQAVLFQHTYGLPGGAADVARVASARGVLMIEDCAQAIPFRSDQGAPGTTGGAAVFSLNLLKPLPAGSGGLAVTRDTALAAAIRSERDRLPPRDRQADLLLRAEALVQRRCLTPRTYWFALTVQRLLRGRPRDQSLADAIAEHITAPGTQIGDLQARRGLRALMKIPDLAGLRADQCAWYEEALRGVRSITTVPRPRRAPLYYYPILSAHKRQLLEHARAARIQVVAWPDRTPVYGIDDAALLPRYGYAPGTCPVAESVAARLVGLPTGLDVRPRHLRAIANLVRRAA